MDTMGGSQLNIAAYGEGCMYPDSAKQPVPDTIATIQASGLTTVILSLLHVSALGDLGLNDNPLIAGGTYVGNATWIDQGNPNDINVLIGGSVTQVEMSIGGGGVKDFYDIHCIYENNGNSFENTNLQQNFKVLKSVLPVVTIIDMDCEEEYDQPSFVAFCQMLIALGFKITFCPYQDYSGFWTSSLAALNASNPGAVVWWNLQCYDGGAGNDPQTWAKSITQAIPGFDTTGFIIAGDWTNDSPAAMEELMSGFSSEQAVGGGFIWTIDETLPSTAPGSLADYVAAIQSGLTS